MSKLSLSRFLLSWHLAAFFCLVCVIISTPYNSYGQFSLDIVKADIDFIEVGVPSGAAGRSLIAQKKSGQTISISLDSCNSGCTIRIGELLPSEVITFSLLRQSDTISRIWGITSSLSTGQTEIYFTTQTDGELADLYPSEGVGGAILEGQIIKRIQEAKVSIDAALYNINRRDIVNALQAAHDRGVRVRYVTGDDTSNTALANPAPTFPVLRGNLGDPLMHHKFFIIDAELPESALVITGATNMTTFQMYEDHNNTLFIQDQSLAKVYSMEMDEMWGGDAAIPNPSLARFGSQKRNDTPHKIFINGKLFESYFSPSDNTGFHITNALNRAQEGVYFSLLILTRSTLASSLINVKNKGLVVRGMIENTDDSGSEYNRLLANGVFVLRHFPDPQLHHKYALIDPLQAQGRSAVVTGSHNWTNNAEFNNDENTLIIHDPFITNVFFSEFQARWCEVFPTSTETCRLTLSTDQHSAPLIDIYNKVRISYTNPQLTVFDVNQKMTSFALFSVSGNVVYATTLPPFKSNSHPLILDLPSLIPGVYRIVFYGGNGFGQTGSFLVH
jgi:phosphatidylserine/phosphatidylglycerophosphate/cardiolipin synthase-like enzyme